MKEAQSINIRIYGQNHLPLESIDLSILITETLCSGNLLDSRLLDAVLLCATRLLSYGLKTNDFTSLNLFYRTAPDLSGIIELRVCELGA